MDLKNILTSAFIFTSFFAQSCGVPTESDSVSAGPITSSSAVALRQSDRQPTNAFEVRQLPDAVSVAVPKEGWQWMSGSQAQALDTNSEARLSNLGQSPQPGDNIVLIAGNAFDSAGHSIATIRVSKRHATSISQKQVRDGYRDSPEEVRQAAISLAQESVDLMQRVRGMQYYRLVDSGVQENTSLTCMWSKFEYDAGGGDMISDTWICPMESGSLKLSTSYSKRFRNLYADTIEYVWRSLIAKAESA